MSGCAIHNPTELDFIAAPDGGRVAELVNTKSSALSNLSLAVVELLPGKAMAHFHRATEEIYYILEGTGIMHMDMNCQRVGPGDAVSIPVGSIHSLENPSATPLRYIALSAPSFDPTDIFYAGSVGP